MTAAGETPTLNVAWGRLGLPEEMVDMQRWLAKLERLGLPEDLMDLERLLAELAKLGLLEDLADLQMLLADLERMGLPKEMTKLGLPCELARLERTLRGGCFEMWLLERADLERMERC